MNTTFTITTRTVSKAEGYHAKLHATGLNREQGERMVFRLMAEGYKITEIDMTPEGV